MNSYLPINQANPMIISISNFFYKKEIECYLIYIFEVHYDHIVKVICVVTNMNRKAILLHDKQNTLL